MLQVDDCDVCVESCVATVCDVIVLLLAVRFVLQCSGLELDVKQPGAVDSVSSVTTEKTQCKISPV